MMPASIIAVAYAITITRERMISSKRPCNAALPLSVQWKKGSTLHISVSGLPRRFTSIQMLPIIPEREIITEEIGGAALLLKSVPNRIPIPMNITADGIKTAMESSI